MVRVVSIGVSIVLPKIDGFRDVRLCLHVYILCLLYMC